MTSVCVMYIHIHLYRSFYYFTLPSRVILRHFGVDNMNALMRALVHAQHTNATNPTTSTPVWAGGWNGVVISRVPSTITTMVGFSEQPDRTMANNKFSK